MMSLSTRSHETLHTTKPACAKKFRRLGVRSLAVGLLSATTFFAFASTGAYATSFVPKLGAAAPYAILGTSLGTDAGNSTITGDLGLTSNSSVSAGTGTASSGLVGGGLLSGAGGLLGSVVGSVSGTTSVASTAVFAAESAARAAYQAAASDVPTEKITGDTLNGVVLMPGVYAVSGSLKLVGRILLDARGERSGDFIFQVPSDLATAPGAELVLGGGASANDVLWQVGGATDLGSGTSFLGTILSNQSITLGPDSKLVGRALSLTGAVNLDRDSVGLPLVDAVVATAGKAVSAVANGVAPTARTKGLHTVTGAATSLSGARVSLPLPSLHSLSAPSVSLPTVPTIGSSTPSVSASKGVGVGLGISLPYIPLGSISVPELAVTSLPTSGVTTPSTGITAPLPSLLPLPLVGVGFELPSLGAPSLPATALTTLGSNATPSNGFTAPIVGIPSLPFLGVPTLPSLTRVGAPTAAVPTVGVPTVTAPSAPSTTAPTGASVPDVSFPLPLSGISLPALTSPSSLPSVSLPSLGTPSSATPASSALPIPPKGISLPRLESPSTSPTPGGISLPAVSLPSVNPSSVSLPKVSTSPVATGSLVHPRVKEGSTSSHSSSLAHAKTGSSSTSPASSSSPIPLGAPQTGFGGMAGSAMLRLYAGLGALLLGACAGGFAIRTRRLRRV